MVYLGVDLHRKRSHVVALDEKGDVLLSRRIASRPEDFCRVFGELEPEPLQVAFEAAYGWSWLADLLADCGIEAHMAHPLATKAISAGRVKNDTVDARTLAHLLRANLLPEAWIALPQVREARRLVRMRASLVRIGSRLRCQIHALLAEHGVQVEHADLFGPAGRRFLASLHLPEISQRRMEANLRLIDAVAGEVESADRELRGLFSAGDPRLRRLLAIPGVGFITAVTVLVEVGEIGRFPDADRLCSWAGLTPTERSSAEHVRRGHISKQGSRWLRWVMVEAAQHVRDPELLRFFERIAQRRGKKIARVALARRILTLCFYALRDEGGCRAYPPQRAKSRSRAIAHALGRGALAFRHGLLIDGRAID